MSEYFGNSHRDKQESLKKEIERQIALQKTGYKSFNLEKLIGEYRKEAMKSTILAELESPCFISTFWRNPEIKNLFGEFDTETIDTFYHKIYQWNSQPYGRQLLNEWQITNPLEMVFFAKYSKGISTELWTDDPRYFETAWRNFEPYVKKNAHDFEIKGIGDIFNSIYGKESWWSSISGGIGAFFGIGSDMGTAGYAGELLKKTPEVTKLMTEGPAAITEKTYTDIFGSPYTEELPTKED